MVQRLARHSDVNLTLGTYTRHELKELAEAVGRLPRLKGSQNQSDSTTSDESQRDLNQVVRAWPNLSDDARSRIVRIIEES
jgi:hypothetical protein